MHSLSIAPKPGEPLAAWFSSPESRDGVTQQRFECTSDGDLVSGRVWLGAATRPRESAALPRGGAALPLVLAIHELTRDARDPLLATSAFAWASAGFTTAAIDLPLHGERHNAKLSRRAIAGAAGGTDAALWRGLLLQAIRDLARALDALAPRLGAPLTEVTSVAFGGSAAIALSHAQLDTRVARMAAIGAPRAVANELATGATKSIHWVERPDDLTAWLGVRSPA